MWLDSVQGKVILGRSHGIELLPIHLLAQLQVSLSCQSSNNKLNPKLTRNMNTAFTRPHPLTWGRQGLWSILLPATRGWSRPFGFTFVFHLYTTTVCCPRVGQPVHLHLHTQSCGSIKWFWYLCRFSSSHGSWFCWEREGRWFPWRQVSVKPQNFINSLLQLIKKIIIKLLTDLFKLRIIADVAKWGGHSSASLEVNWFGCCTRELFTLIGTVTGSNHPSALQWFTKAPAKLNGAMKPPGWID